MSDVLDLSLRALLATPLTTPERTLEARRAPATPSRSGAAPAPDVPANGAEVVVHEAVLALVARELAALVRALPLDRAAAALRERDPTAAVGGLLADAAVARAMVAADDPLGLALLHGARRKRELLEQARGAWPAGTAAHHLGITRQGVDKRRQAGTLLGVRVPSGEWAYPVAQFGPDGAPLPGLAAALAALRAGGVTSGWTQLEQLLAPDPALSPRAVDAYVDASSDAHLYAGGAAAPGTTRRSARRSARGLVRKPARVGRVTSTADAEAPRSALHALREDGAHALPAVLAALRQAGDLDGDPEG